MILQKKRSRRRPANKEELLSFLALSLYHETMGGGMEYILEGESLCMCDSGASFLCVHEELSYIVTRESRDGWPLLTFETELQGTQRLLMKAVLNSLVNS
jgi:hypothetical protein